MRLGEVAADEAAATVSVKSRAAEKWSGPANRNLVRDHSNKGRCVQHKLQIDARGIHSERSDPGCGSEGPQSLTRSRTPFGREVDPDDGERELGFRPSEAR